MTSYEQRPHLGIDGALPLDGSARRFGMAMGVAGLIGLRRPT